MNFDFDSKRVPDTSALTQQIKRRVTIGEMHDGKLQWSSREKLTYSVNSPIIVPAKTKVMAELLITAKEEVLAFSQPITLRGHIKVDLYKRQKEGDVQFVRPLEGKIEKIVSYFKANHPDMEGFEEHDDDKKGFVRFETTGTVKFSVGTKEHIKVSEEELD